MCVLYDKTFTSIRILQVLHVRVFPKVQCYLLDVYYFVHILEQVCFSSTRYGCIQLWHLCCWDCQGKELPHLLISFDLSLSLMRLFGGDSNSSLLVAIHLLSTQRVLLYCAGCVGWSWISCKSNSSFCSRGGPSTAPHYYPHKICWRGMSCAIILISKPKFEISIIDGWELKSHSHDSLHNVLNLSGPQTNIFSD